MGDLSKNFSLREFKCQCGCETIAIDPDLIRDLQEARDRFGPIRITSGYRCAEHNAKIGGAKNSRHILGQAADIQVRDQTPRVVSEYFDTLYPDSRGIGTYVSWTHYDTRESKARWSKVGPNKSKS